MNKKSFIFLKTILLLMFLVLLITSCKKSATYTITFDSLGGTVIESQIVKEGDYVSKPADPTKDGFTFIEWKLNDKTYDFNSSVTQNLILTAYYQANEGTEVVLVTFDYQNGQEKQIVEIIKGGQIVEPNQPKKQGYAFVGWYSNEEKFDFSTELNENILLIAKWKESHNTTYNVPSHETNETSTILANKGTSAFTDSNKNQDYRYLIFEKENGGYSVTGVTDTAPCDIIIPEKHEGLPVTSIGSWSFAYNEKITSIVIPSSVFIIEEYAFEQCDGLKTISIGKGVSTIDKGAFRCCTNLTSITIPGNVKNINNNAFEGCLMLSDITIASGVQKIGNSAFVGTALSNIIIPDTVTSMGESVFNNCVNLSNVIVGKGISQISNGTFAYCEKLSFVTVSGNIKSIGEHAFYLCENLKTIIFDGSINEWNKIMMSEDWDYGTPTLTVKCLDGTIILHDNTDYTNPTPTNPPQTEQRPIRVSGIKINNTSLDLNVGDMRQLTSVVLPSDATNKNVVWTSNNSSVVQVSSSGNVIALSTGNATITVVTEDGGYEATCSVTVKEMPTSTNSPTYTDVLIISDTRTISDETINTDVYITSTGVATFKNVTINGNVYCYGKLTVSGGKVNNLYAYYWDMGGGHASCDAWDGTHGLVKGYFSSAKKVEIKDYSLDYAFDKWGKK